MLERLADEVARRQAGRASLGRDDQAVREHGLGGGLDVVGRDEAAAVRERPRLGDAQERDPGARARAEVDPRVAARLAQQRDDVAVDALLDEDLAGRRGDSERTSAAVATGRSDSSGGSLVCSVSIRASSGSGG